MHRFVTLGHRWGDNRRIEQLAVDLAPTPGYPVGVVAARLGVPTATLRSWTQRYGLAPNGHSRGKHRLYNESDIAVLDHMLRLVQSGVPPASAAESLRRRWYEEPSQSGDDAAHLAALARQLDTLGMSQVLSRSLRIRGVVETWDALCRPAFALIGDRQSTSPCIDAEHALSWAVSGSLRQVVQCGKATRPAGIILACVPGEHHLLPLEALAAALAEASVAVCMLGSDVPIVAVRDAAERTRPVALTLWSQSPATADLAVLEIGLQFSGAVFAAGPGWPRQLPDGVELLDSMSTAIDALTQRGRSAST